MSDLNNPPVTTTGPEAGTTAARPTTSPRTSASAARSTTVAPDASTAPAGSTPQTGQTPPAAGTVAPQVTDEVAKKAADLIESVAAAATKTTSVGATTKVKMLHNHPRVGAFANTVTELPAALAAELIAGKYATHVSANGEGEESAYGEPTAEQLALAKAAYGRFRAVAETHDEVEPMPEFETAPEKVQRAFVAAIDPSYGPQA